MMPMITALSVNMIFERLVDEPSPISVALRKPLLPNTVIQPAARTALPTNSGSTTSMISRFLNRDLRAGKGVGQRKAERSGRLAVQISATRTRGPEDLEIVGVGEEPDVVLERECVDHHQAGLELVQAVAEQDRHRNDQGPARR